MKDREVKVLVSEGDQKDDEEFEVLPSHVHRQRLSFGVAVYNLFICGALYVSAYD